MKRLSFVPAILLSAVACGDATPAPTQPPPGEGAGGEAAASGEEAGPPAPCAVLVESGEASRVVGQTPDNATATQFRLEELPDRAGDLENNLVRTQGVVEVVGPGGRWFVLYDALFDGWVFVSVPSTLQVQAGAKGCKATVEGIFYRVRLEESDVESQRRAGRPEESFAEEGPDSQITMQALELTPPAAQ